MRIAAPLTLIAATAILSGCGEKSHPDQYGPNPALPTPQRGLLPTRRRPRCRGHPKTRKPPEAPDLERHNRWC